MSEENADLRLVVDQLQAALSVTAANLRAAEKARDNAISLSDEWETRASVAERRVETEAREFIKLVEHATNRADLLAVQLAAAEKRVAALQAVLMKHGRHSIRCALLRTGDFCDCGLDAAIAGQPGGIRKTEVCHCGHHRVWHTRVGMAYAVCSWAACGCRQFEEEPKAPNSR